VGIHAFACRRRDVDRRIKPGDDVTTEFGWFRVMSDYGVLLQQVINGLSLGAMYALLALGFTLVYGILELINFAHFNVFMVSSFVGMWALQLLGITGQSRVLTGLALAGTLLFAFAVTMFAAGALGVVIERLSLRPLRGVPGTAAMITTIGVSYILFNIILLTVGAGSENYPNPLPVVRWQLGEVTLDLKELLIWAVALVLMLALHLFVSRTRLGKAMRATAQDAEAARMMGVDVDRVIVTAFFLGSALAGAAALIFGLYYNYTSFIIGYTAGLRAFTAAVLGGIGSIPGAMLGGLLIGLIETLGGQLIAVRWTDVIIFSILVLVLVFVPSGLLGRAAPAKS
jgi:branched-chain amino acid transport system permease protein